ncbi:SbcC/MukB-like Walker B domain-containing protein [Bacillus sp. sid0103]|uniref:SbcC/MukB-like Walker B domain-containing protein n=1 Tax=Bacillus sp. sid0103 TaxID=2856337 RepID=UPI001C478A0D|nr:SbcC/MukB-like Walker B domain-containing protein [Bacillus sp. sid0103]
MIDIEALLKSSGAEEEEKEIEKLRTAIKDLEKEEKDKNKEEPILEQKKTTTKEQIEKAETELIFLNRQLDIQEEVFGLELKNNRIEWEKSLEKVAQEYQKESNITEAQREMDRAVLDFRSKDLEGYLPSSQEIVSGTRLITVGEFPDKADRIHIINNARKRLRVTLLVNGSKKNPKEFYDYLQDLETQQRSFLKQDEETLIKKVMIQGLGEKIKDLIGKAVDWKNDINTFMKSLNNSIELRLLWEPIDKNDRNAEDHLTTSQLVSLLGRDFSTLRDTDIEALSKHFMSKINLAKERLDRKSTSKEDTAENLEQALKQVLDYRDWYKFKIMYTLEGSKEKVLDEKNLNILSGGEKAMAIYIPLFSAAYSKYNTSSPDAPYIIALDEAFAGVDEENISEMFSLMERLGFNYILTSQALWADYPTVSGINIYELSFDKVEQYVFSEPWRWDGKKLEFNEEVLFEKGIEGDEQGDLHGDPVQESLFDIA